jgi:repressor LexA
VNDGDKVVVRKQDTAKDGEMVIARIRKDPTNVVTTLKRLYRRNGTVWLQPENPTLQPVPFTPDEIEIQATVITIIRNVSGSGARNLRVN